MKIPFCTPLESKRFTQYLHSRYGIPLPLMRDWKWMVHQGNAHVVSSEGAGWAGSKANLFALGLQVFTDTRTFAPTSTFIALMGDHISQNRVELSAQQLDSFFSRKKIGREYVSEKSVLSDGWVAVSLHGKVIGSGDLTRNHLIPNLPGQGHEAQDE